MRRLLNRVGDRPEDLTSYERRRGGVTVGEARDAVAARGLSPTQEFFGKPLSDFADTPQCAGGCLPERAGAGIAAGALS
jgi:hypothetical protein